MSQFVLSNFFFSSNDTFMPANSNWDCIGTKSKVNPVIRSSASNRANTQYTEVNFTMYFRRRPNYYLVNFFGPSVILGALQLSSFFIPASEPDRAAYAVTVMLSIFVLQNQILTTLPQTPKLIIANMYIMAIMLYGMSCAIYAGIMCSFINLTEFASRKIKMCSSEIKVHTLIDFVMFAVFGAALAFLIIGVNANMRK